MSMEHEDDNIQDHVNVRAREAKRLSSRPSIDHLLDAVVERDGKLHFLPEKGTRVIIERLATVLSHKPWLDTKSYIVESVDQETGDIRLQDEEMHHASHSNFKTALELGYRLKLPGAKDNGSYVPRKAPPIVLEDEPTSEKPKSSKPKSSSDVKETERRIYATRGVIHTRIKGLAYVPSGTTQASDGMRLVTIVEGTNIKVFGPDKAWEEVWTPNAEL